MKSASLILIILLSTACGGGTGVISADDVAPDAALEISEPADTLAPPADAAADTDAAPREDVPEADAPPVCQPGDGCFLDPCTDDGDCVSGHCVPHMGNKVCTTECAEECPGGWTCEQIGGGPDAVFLCLSPFAVLCRPCADDQDCKSPTGEDVCLDYGPSGSFCGAACEGTGACPAGYSCNQMITLAGVSLDQCTPDAGECGCSETAITLGLSTPCEVSNEIGTCTGLRTCLESGLSDCDALEPAEEICNALDDDCDGETDEGGCDDGNDCTEDLCEGDAGCAHVPLDGTSCDDLDVCTLADHCEAGVCLGTGVNCDDGNLCTNDVCDPTGGCLYQFNDLGCDDGDPCTINDSCAGGACGGFQVPCDCHEDLDCAALEDGDLCNGTLVCDLDAFPQVCVVDPATLVNCPEPEGVDAACLVTSCAPLTGTCGFDEVDDGIWCDDDDACTIGDACDDGACVAGPPLNCNDGNPCTDDSCDPADGCLHSANAAPCTDGDTCTLGDLCAEGVCVAGVAADCDDGNPCTDDACDPGIGCVHQANSDPCDDSNACTLTDLCAGGLCVGATSPDCDDGNLCTTDSCDPLSGCQHTDNTHPCSDDDLCTQDDLCAEGSCVPGAAVSCDDSNPCTDDSCDAAAGCVYQDNTDPCDDGNACTTGDACGGGLCLGGAAADCDDQDLCTDDGCDPSQGCVFTINSAPCDDGSVCTTGDHCHLGSCISSGILTCEDSNPCTDDSCHPSSGCQFSPNAEACDDLNPCTTGDFCELGVCLGGDTLDCGDEVDCTQDSCDPFMGCVHTPMHVLCADDIPCTVDVCGEAGCTHEPDHGACDDAVDCTVDACGQAGCEHQPDDGACEDGDPCTLDACAVDAGCEHVLTVDYDIDPDNCGSCGHQCEADEICEDGDCVVPLTWDGAGAAWAVDGDVYGRFTWAQAGTSNNGRANAAAYCAAHGGTLARPNSQAAWDAIYTHVTDSYGWWIDGSNLYSCGSATPGNPKAYQYGNMYCPTGTSTLYTGCNCTSSEQGLVVYRYVSSYQFDGCQSMTGSGNLGAMDEQLSYSHSGIQGFICVK